MASYRPRRSVNGLLRWPKLNLKRYCRYKTRMTYLTSDYLNSALIPSTLQKTESICCSLAERVIWQCLTGKQRDLCVNFRPKTKSEMCAFSRTTLCSQLHNPSTYIFTTIRVLNYTAWENIVNQRNLTTCRIISFWLVRVDWELWGTLTFPWARLSRKPGPSVVSQQLCNITEWMELWHLVIHLVKSRCGPQIWAVHQLSNCLRMLLLR